MKLTKGLKVRFTVKPKTYIVLPKENEVLTVQDSVHITDSWIHLKGDKGFDNYIERKYLSPGRTHNLNLL